jgi:hypothetical protein
VVLLYYGCWRVFWFPAVYKEEDGFFGVLLLPAVPTEREAEREKRAATV